MFGFLPAYYAGNIFRSHITHMLADHLFLTAVVFSTKSPLKIEGETRVVWKLQICFCCLKPPPLMLPLGNSATAELLSFLILLPSEHLNTCLLTAAVLGAGGECLNTMWPQLLRDLPLMLSYVNSPLRSHLLYNFLNYL